MMNRFLLRILLLLVSGNLAGPLFSAESSAPASPPTAARAENSESSTNGFHPVKPGPDDGKIAFTMAWMLEHSQFLHQAFNDEVSTKFFGRYLETYDSQHLHFLQSDLAQFDHYRTNLNRLTRGADTTPACAIFNRFMERLEQHVAFVDDLLDHAEFTFDTDERVVINRKDLPYPKDLEEAKCLWRDRLRAEYLQEKLVNLGAKKKAAHASPGSDSPKAAMTEAVPPANPGPALNQLAAKPKTEHQEILDTLRRRYHRTLRAFAELSDDDVLSIYLTTLAHVYDPHSDYMNHSQLENFAIAMNLRLEGIGAELRSEDGYCIINHLLPGPASKSKQIKEGDRIVAVAQSNSPPVDLVDMRLDKAVQLIRGPKGTQVTLTILPAAADASARRCVTLVRDEIKIEDQEAKAKVLELPDTRNGNLRLGVIDLPSFYATMDLTPTHGPSAPKSTSADVRRLLAKLKKENVSGLILDLRHNGGGSLDEAIRLTGLFIKEGPVVQVENYNGAIEQDPDPDPALVYEGPLIVLTSRLSASASEILAGALQDYGRALIVGDTSTHGKGTVQSLVPVNVYYTNLTHRPALANDPGAMKITIKKFFRPSGASSQKTGVIPDLILPSVLGESKEIGESTLDNPLPAGRPIPSAQYEHLNLVAPCLPELRKRSAQRLATDPEYAYIRQDIELYKRLLADKSVSLNEKQRLKQNEEDEAREQARQKERLARKPPQDVIVHELTLRQVDQPGLPPPVGKTNSLAGLSPLKRPGAPISSTNAALATKADVAAAQDHLANDLQENKPPAGDAALAETEHILVDYLSILPKTGFFTARRETPP